MIPVTLEDCDVPERLRRWYWVNLFESGGYDKLLKSLRVRLPGTEKKNLAERERLAREEEERAAFAERERLAREEELGQKSLEKRVEARIRGVGVKAASERPSSVVSFLTWVMGCGFLLLVAALMFAGLFWLLQHS